MREVRPAWRSAEAEVGFVCCWLYQFPGEGVWGYELLYICIRVVKGWGEKEEVRKTPETPLLASSRSDQHDDRVACCDSHAEISLCNCAVSDIKRHAKLYVLLARRPRIRTRLSNVGTAGIIRDFRPAGVRCTCFQYHTTE